MDHRRSAFKLLIAAADYSDEELVVAAVACCAENPEDLSELPALPTRLRRYVREATMPGLGQLPRFPVCLRRRCSQPPHLHRRRQGHRTGNRRDLAQAAIGRPRRPETVHRRRRFELVHPLPRSELATLSTFDHYNPPRPWRFQPNVVVAATTTLWWLMVRRLHHMVRHPSRTPFACRSSTLLSSVSMTMNILIYFLGSISSSYYNTSTKSPDFFLEGG